MNESIKTKTIPPTNMIILNIDSRIFESEIMHINIFQWKKTILEILAHLKKVITSNKINNSN